jgi:rfaE bifunctional protein nucleotidyltransferase chain/domain
MHKNTNRAQNATTDNHRKIVTREELFALRREAREAGQVVAQCHGCFDIVHPGHVRHLRFAAQQGDRLLVTITADNLVDKGEGRPLFSEELRAENLAALDFVDWVYINPDATARDLLEDLQPDIYIKGQEYERNRDPRFLAEREAVERHGGRIVFSSGDLVFSSTELVSALARGMTAHDEAHDPRHARMVQLHRTHELNADHLTRTIDNVAGRRLVVVGETILDRYYFCDRPNVASEASCLSIRPIEDVTFDGGAAIMARHAVALGARVTLITVLSDDAAGRSVRERLQAEGIDVRTPIAHVTMPVKERYLVGSEKIVKIDRIQPHVLDEQARATVVDIARAAVGAHADAVLLADFRLGLFTRSLLIDLIAAIRPHVDVFAGDVSGRRHLLDAMRNLDLVTPSETELRDTVQDFDSSLNAVVWQYLQRSNVRRAIVTLGSAGAVAFAPKANPVDSDGGTVRLDADHVPALIDHAVDPLGCGDALLTMSALALAGGATLVQSAYLGSIAAAQCAMRLGNLPLDRTALKRRIRQLDSTTLAVTASSNLERNVERPLVLYAG